MIDLFGLGKKEEPKEPATAPAAEAPAADSAEAAAPRGSHKLWAFLLVLDSVFVIIFAGAVAAKVYQHWKSPAAPIVTAPRRRPGKADAPPAAPPAASTETPKAPEPPKEAAKAPEPAPKPAPAAKPAPDAPRPPKPSMLSEAPKHRETPKLAGPGPAPKAAETRPAAPPPPPADGKTKAIKTEFKIHAPRAKAVELVGAFIVRGGRREMTRQDDGTWTVTLYLNPGAYRYFFSVDKKKQLDPENPHSEKGASLLSVP